MEITLPFWDCTVAGQLLAEALERFAGRDDLLVLALPRGGVPIAFEVARSLGAPLDLLLSRRISAPGHEELALGAVAGGARIINDDVAQELGVDEKTIDALATAAELERTRREAVYRGD